MTGYGAQQGCGKDGYGVSGPFRLDKEKFSAVVLAGGESRRMAAPKAWAEVGGVPIIRREIDALGQVFDEVIIVANGPGRFGELGLKVVPDAFEFAGLKGPLLGAYSGIRAAATEYCFIAACDMPFISQELMYNMAGFCDGAEAVIPAVGPGGRLIEPLFGFYARSALSAMEDALKGGAMRIRDVIAALDVRYVDEGWMRGCDPGLLSLINVNTPEDLLRAALILKAAEKG